MWRTMAALASLITCGASCAPGAREIDASVPEGRDASGPGDAALPCQDDETIVSDAFGTLVQWNGGAPLSAGHYTISYLDGCMKYSPSYGWSVNAYENGPYALYVIADGAQLAPAPGTIGFYLGQGGFASFDDCVAANLASDASFEFDFAGGTLGLKLVDDPYNDNVAGENGRNPTYHLSCVVPVLQ